jgi:hypothetical protein
MRIKELKNYLRDLLAFIIGQLIFVILSFNLLKTPYLFIINFNAIPNNIRNSLKWANRRAITMHPTLSKTFKTGKALIIYYSKTGNTQKVALTIERGLRKGGLEPTIKRVSEAFDEDYYNYDLVCFGTPCFHALPPPPVMKFVHKNFIRYRKNPSEVRVPAIPIPGKYALVFITFSGPHVGVNEALPAGKWLVQEFEHLGFEVRGEWYCVGEFHGWKKGSTYGKMGDIRGRPNPEDLARIEERTIVLTHLLKSMSKDKDLWVMH